MAYAYLDSTGVLFINDNLEVAKTNADNNEIMDVGIEINARNGFPLVEYGDRKELVNLVVYTKENEAYLESKYTGKKVDVAEFPEVEKIVNQLVKGATVVVNTNGNVEQVVNEVSVQEVQNQVVQ